MNKFYVYCLSLLCIAQTNLAAEEKDEKNKENRLEIASELSLEGAMNAAEAHSYQIKIASQNVNISQSTKNAAILSTLPKVSLEGSYQIPVDGINSLVNVDVSPDLSTPTVGRSLNAGLTATQPILGLVSIALSIAENSAQLSAARNTRNQTVQDQRYLGANSYINATKALELVAVAEEAIDVAEKQLADAQARFNEGLSTNADVLQFKLNLDNTKTTRVRIETTYQVALVTLAEIIGYDVKTIMLPEHYKSVMEHKKEHLGKLSQLIEQRLPLRYDIQASKDKIAEKGYATLNTMTDYLPALNFTTTYSRDFKKKSVPFFSRPQGQDSMFLGLSFSWNVFDWGIRQTKISAAGATEQIANLNFFQLRDNARIDITSGYNKLFEAYETLHYSETSVKYAESVYQQRYDQFQHGLISSTDLVIASNDQTSARANYVSAIGELDLAWMAFFKAVRQPLSTLN